LELICKSERVDDGCREDREPYFCRYRSKCGMLSAQIHQVLGVVHTTSVLTNYGVGVTFSAPDTKRANLLSDSVLSSQFICYIFRTSLLLVSLQARSRPKTNSINSVSNLSTFSIPTAADVSGHGWAANLVSIIAALKNTKARQITSPNVQDFVVLLTQTEMTSLPHTPDLGSGRHE
jgi:hypothetical protein